MSPMKRSPRQRLRRAPSGRAAKPRGWDSAHERAQAERSLLAALIAHKGAVERVRGVLASAHFARGAHRAIYAACLAVTDRGLPMGTAEVCCVLLNKPATMAELIVDVLPEPPAPARVLAALARRIAAGRKLRGYITANQIARVRDGTDVVALVSETVSLTKSGRGLIGRCPFHRRGARLGEPMFRLSPRSGLWHCDRCKESGDAFVFVERVKRCTFTEAIRWLAERSNVALHPLR